MADRGVLGTVVWLSRICLPTVDPSTVRMTILIQQEGKYGGATTKKKWEEKVCERESNELSVP